MAPRGSTKIKRGPGSWNQRAKKPTTDNSQQEDDASPPTSGKSRGKFPPGPDPAFATLEEFFTLPPNKPAMNNRSPSLPAAGSSRTHSSPERDIPDVAAFVGVRSTTAGIRLNPPAIPEKDEGVETHDNRNRGKSHDASDTFGGSQCAEPERWTEKAIPSYDVNTIDNKYRGKKRQVEFKSPVSRHRRSRRHRREITSESEESDRRRKRSHRSKKRRSKKRRSRRSSSRSSSTSSSDRDGRCRSFDREVDARRGRSEVPPSRDAAHRNSHDWEILLDRDLHSQQYSDDSVPHRRPTEQSPPSRGHPLRVPYSNTSYEKACSDHGNFEQGMTSRGGGSCSVNPWSLKKESADRKDRRDREKMRDDIAARRVSEGKKKHLVHVNKDGRPYGLGVGTWNVTLGRLVRRLDPSYIDIRHQPFHLMETMIARLNDDFEYTDDVDCSYLRGRIGTALSSYRHDLIKIIDAEGDRPLWVSEEIWSRLVTMAGTDKFKIKSEQMKRANACRRSKGRTGPIGIAGVAERLRLWLGRSPDPEEIQEEAQRDKSKDRRPRARNVDAVGDDMGGGTLNASVENSHEEFVESAPASNEVSNNVNSTVGTSALHEIPLRSPGIEKSPLTDSVDLDLAFAREHPLGKVLLKQMAELRSVEGCDTPELHMILEGLTSQIRNLRKTISSAPPRQKPYPVTEVDNSHTLNFKAAGMSPEEPIHMESLPVHPAPAAEDEPGIQDLHASDFPPVEAPAAGARRSGRIPKKKNSDLTERVSNYHVPKRQV